MSVLARANERTNKGANIPEQTERTNGGANKANNTEHTEQIRTRRTKANKPNKSEHERTRTRPNAPVRSFGSFGKHKNKYLSLLSRYCNLSRCYTPLLRRYSVTFKSKLTYSLGGCVVLARTRNLLIIIYLYERNYDCRCRGYIDITKPANGQRLMANGLILRQSL